MPVERSSGGSSLIDVLDRVLDKGIVIDAWVRVSLVGIDLITVEARVVVASIDTYLKYSEAVAASLPVAPALVEGGTPSYNSSSENNTLQVQLRSHDGLPTLSRRRASRMRRQSLSCSSACSVSATSATASITRSRGSLPAPTPRRPSAPWPTRTRANCEASPATAFRWRKSKRCRSRSTTQLIR
jgi:hypothetical protein